MKMPSLPQPPRAARRLLDLVLGPQEAEEIDAGLSELFETRVRERGATAARLWYWRQVLGFAARWRSARRFSDSPMRPPGPGAAASDIRYALRSLRKNPGFTFVAIITLAVGIGANTAIFSLVHSLILNPMPFEGGERVVQLWRTGAQYGRSVSLTPTQEMMAAWREHARSFDTFAGYDEAEFLYLGADGPQVLQAASVSPELLTLAHATPLVGRLFTAEDAEPAGEQPVILSEGFWNLHFGADPGVVGSSLILDDEPYVVVGVLPRGIRSLFEAGFVGIEPTDVWTPLSIEADGSWASEPFVIARLTPGVTPSMAEEELGRIQAGLVYEGADDFDWLPYVQSAMDALDRDLRRGLWVLLGAVAFVLLIVCVNIANLLLARGVTRGPEFAIRAALGAGRFRVVRQLLTESFVLTLTGAALGLLLASWSIAGVASILGERIPEMGNARIEPVVLAFTLGLVLLTGLLFGLAPVGRLRAMGVGALLRQGTRSGAGGPWGSRMRGWLVSVEVGLALVLFLGAGLLVNSFLRLQQVDPGFDTNNLVAMELKLPDERYPDVPARVAFYEDVVDRMRRIPQVRAVTWSRSVPPRIAGAFGRVWIEGRTLEEDDTNPIHAANWVTPEYFATVGATLREGRTFAPEEMAEFPTAIIINRTAAEHYWPEGGAVGSRLRLVASMSPDNPSPFLTVVGVVDDVKAWWLGDDPARVQFHIPATDRIVDQGSFIVRTEGDPEELIPLLKEQVWAVDPLQPIAEVYEVRDQFRSTVVRQRFNAILLTGFAVLGLFLAVLGVYGVISIAVGQRTREIAVRVAMGARRSDITRMVVGSGMRAVAIGVVVGLGASLALTRFIENLLFEIEATDPATYGAVIAVLTTIGALACYVPSRQATAVDPVEALKEE